VLILGVVGAQALKQRQGARTIVASVVVGTEPVA
jgi:hypothetical protein